METMKPKEVERAFGIPEHTARHLVRTNKVHGKPGWPFLVDVNSLKTWLSKRNTQKAISIRQPWAWLIVNGYKDIENRTWQTKYTGKILIHASKKIDYKAYEWVKNKFDIKIPNPKDLLVGGIVGKVNVVNCTTISSSKWFIGPYGFVLDYPETLPFMPCKGKLGLFNIDYRGGVI